MQQQQLKTSVVSVGELLQYKQLVIPTYQRPYKWTHKNVSQLIKDIYTFRSKSAYRLGTVVLHDDQEQFNIVDGQQRIVTLLLIVQAIFKHHSDNIKNQELKKLLYNLRSNIFNPAFSNDISVANINSNYRIIEKEVITFDEEVVNFLLNKCEVIQFVLNDVSEAFQFFDAQNARGRDLEPHDILKAFHLREFSDQDELHKTTIVDTWESMQTDELSGLFADFLYKVRSWSRLQSARYLTKSEIELFKGVNIEKLDTYLYAAPLRIIHHFVDHYNQNYERHIDKNTIPYPFQLDQPIINGRRFFEMISHYKKTYDTYINKTEKMHQSLNSVSEDILNAINSYEGRNRIGDTYVRMLFDCTLLYYIDRFGYIDINKAIEKIFIWTYSIRLNYQNVQLASVDNYVLENLNLFRTIKDATIPDELFSLNIPSVEFNYSTKTKEIEELFKSLRYYGNQQA